MPLVAEAVRVMLLPRQMLWLPAGEMLATGRGLTVSVNALGADVQLFKVDVTEKFITPPPVVVKTGTCPVPEVWLRPSAVPLAVQL